MTDRTSIHAQIYESVKDSLDRYADLTDMSKWEVVNDAIATYTGHGDTELIEKRIEELDAENDRLRAQIESNKETIEALEEVREEAENHRENYEDALADLVDYFKSEQPNALIIADNVRVKEVAREHGQSPSTVANDVFEHGDFNADRFPSDENPANPDTTNTDSDTGRFDIDDDADDVEVKV